MKKEITVTAKTVADAVARAVAELGAPSADEIEYTVLEEPSYAYCCYLPGGVNHELAGILTKCIYHMPSDEPPPWYQRITPIFSEA